MANLIVVVLEQQTTPALNVSGCGDTAEIFGKVTILQSLRNHGFNVSPTVPGEVMF
ncbi:MAG: hypothetical protein Q9207_004296 [Kuettlingeria erythrocarpa]